MLCVSLCACGERAPETPKAPSCTSDQDCTGGWVPSVPTGPRNGTFQATPNCGPNARCSSGQCLPPAAMVGRAGPDTGSISFETAKGPKAYQVELARSGFETGRGLMCRDSMKPDWGMLFIMSARRTQRFWMKNTLIPLDMVFLDEAWKVVGVAADVQPLDLSGAGVDKPSRYVLELVAGQAKAQGIEAGTQASYTPPAAL